MNPGPPAPGWYADPTVPGQDRWWNGMAWTERTATTPRQSLVGPGFERALRAGDNTIATISQRGGGIALLGVLVLGFLLQFVALPIQIMIFLYATFGVLGAAAAVAGVLGMRRSPRLGGFAPAVLGLILGAIAALMSAVVRGLAVYLYA